MAKLNLRTKEDVRLAIRKRGIEIAAAMTDQELYSSQEFQSYATRLADFILRKHRLYSLKIVYDPDPAAPIAYTDGKSIVWNTGNPLAKTPKLLERRFKCNMGVLFHECAHKLFLDFKTQRKALEKIENGKLFGKFETFADSELDAALAELTDVTASGYGISIAEIYANVSNIISDGHDEAAMKRTFPGFIKECIDTAGQIQMEQGPSLSDAISERCDSYSIFCSLMLQYAKFGYYKIGNDSQEVQEYLDRMHHMEPIIDTAMETDSMKDQWNNLNLLILHLWPVLREKFPKNRQQSQSGSQSSSSAQGSSQPSFGGQPSQGSGNQQQPSSEQEADNQSSGNSPSPEEVQQSLQQAAAQASQAMNAAPAPVNCNNSAIDPASIQSYGMDPGASSDISGIAQQAAQASAIASVQSELDKAQMDAIRNTNLPLIHTHVPVSYNRHNPKNEVLYHKISRKIDPIVRNLIQQMKNALRDLTEFSIQRHRRIGPIIEATEAYRPDRSFFAKKKLPADVPDMAISVLIDQSGSMYGEKLRCARETAILLERFASALDIPIMIAGHDVSDVVNLRIYTDFLSAMSDEDRYSLAGIEDGGCNRDGLPIRLCCELLEKRPERVKLMVIISDGAPNDSGYRGAEARKDISQTVQQFRRKGLLIYGAAIDDDKDVIQEIYGDGFLSIQNLTNLPKTLVRLIKQQMI